MRGEEDVWIIVWQPLSMKYVEKFVFEHTKYRKLFYDSLVVDEIQSTFHCDTLSDVNEMRIKPEAVAKGQQCLIRWLWDLVYQPN